jgi:hypothetical protein
MAKVKDVTGQRFGHLVAVKPVGKAKSGNTIWQFQCDCGKLHEAVGYAVFRGDVVSCGHVMKESLAKRAFKAEDITGKRFGRLVAVEPTTQTKNGTYKWLCQCDCGNTTEAAVSQLKNGNISSCGCFRNEQASKRMVGINNPSWKGGISFGPYCPKFNEALKEEVREAFNHTCVICGAVETDKKHAVHHVDYNKVQGCKGMRWSLVPLCGSCHSKTNHNRWFWFNKLINYWVQAYDMPQ